MSNDKHELSYLKYVLAGKLNRDFILPISGRPFLDIPGGALFYAASALNLWDTAAGLIARIDPGYPQEWLEQLKTKGFDTTGIKRISEMTDTRAFYAYPDENKRDQNRPVGHFAARNLEFPKALLGYSDPLFHQDSKTTPAPDSIRSIDVPENYLEASAAHLCPLDYLSHILLTATLRQGKTTTITLDPSSGYMLPAFWDAIPALVKNLTAFITNEAKLRSLFTQRGSDLWEMAAAIGAYGCELVVVKCGKQGQLLYDSVSKSRWLIPAYPAHMIDPTGAGDAFCGGFLAGYRATYNPLEAVIHGNIAASLAVECSGPFAMHDTYPGLVEARLNALRSMVRKI
ncbi:MAG TPA: carbohydrate kinase family protein [Longilinea sp.]|nr:carbohydrate kinase family protein [Longilinea sp.]